MPRARPSTPPAPCVVLLHTLPDASSHFDWLTARTNAPDAPLLSFRTALRPESPAIDAFSAEPLPDHRALYLDFQGPLDPKDGRDRGDVVRLARGTARIEHADDERVVIVARWANQQGGAPRRYEGTPSGARWGFRVSPEA